VTARGPASAGAARNRNQYVFTLSFGVNDITQEWPPLTADSAYGGACITGPADVMGRM
jgi:hypothetical protein